MSKKNRSVIKFPEGSQKIQTKASGFTLSDEIDKKEEVSEVISAPVITEAVIDKAKVADQVSSIHSDMEVGYNNRMMSQPQQENVILDTIIVPKSTVTPPKATVDLEQAKKYMTEYLNIYKVAGTKQLSKVHKDQHAVNAFTNCVKLLRKYPYVEIFKLMVDFFRVNRTKVIDPRYALGGITPAFSESVFNRVAGMYDILTRITSEHPSATKINSDTLPILLQDENLVKVVIQYLSTYK